MALACAIAAATAIPAPAAARAPETGWRQAETEHFLFIFEPRDRAAVDELLTFCEEVYGQVTRVFHSYPKKVPCVVRGRVDTANGVTMSFPSKIELYLSAPTDYALGARTESWLKPLLIHELTHFVHQSMDTGLFHGLSLVFGGDIATIPLGLLPGWMIEGPAVHDETRFTAGGRGRNPLFEMYTRAPVQEGRLFSLEQAAYSSAFPPPGRIYVAGSFLMDHLLATYGEDALERIMKEYLQFPFFGPWDAIRKVTGMSGAEIFAAASDSLSRADRPFLRIRPGRLVSPDRIGDWTHPQATRAGLYVYRRSPDAVSAIVRLDPETSAERVIRTGSLSDFFSFSATLDGTTIYLSSETSDTRDPSAPVITADVYRVDVGTGATRQVTRGAHLWQPAVSPDGGSLVAVQGSGPYTRLVSVDQETGELRVLFSRAEGSVTAPAFSPDGRRVAFVFNLRGFQDVFTADFDVLQAGSTSLGDPRTAVTDVNPAAARPVLGPDPYGEYFPVFVDNGRLLFSSDRRGSLSLYTADLTTGDVSLVQADPVAAIAAVKDGDSLFYSSYSSKGWCLRETRMGGLMSIPLEQRAGMASPPPPAIAWTGRFVPSRSYNDWPAPIAWLPNVTINQTGPALLDLSIGAGALAFGGSLLGRSSWSLDSAWSIGASQPLGGFSVSTLLGPATLKAASRLDYRYVGYYAQTAETGIALTLPLISTSSFDTSRNLSLRFGLDDIAEMDADTPFTSSDTIGAPASAWQNRLVLRSGAAFGWRVRGGQIDFNPPLALEGEVENGTPLPVFAAAAPESDLAIFLALNLPLFIPHQVVKLGLKATYVTGGPFASYVDDFAVPRGFAGRYARAIPGGALAGIDYLVPVALLDQPLFLGLAITALGLGLHAEGIGQWDIAPLRGGASPVVYVGGDLTVNLVYGAFSLPIGLGCAARIDVTAPNGFDAQNDLRLYVFVGFDSFGSFAKQERMSGARAKRAGSRA